MLEARFEIISQVLNFPMHFSLSKDPNKSLKKHTCFDWVAQKRERLKKTLQNVSVVWFQIPKTVKFLVELYLQCRSMMRFHCCPMPHSLSGCAKPWHADKEVWWWVPTRFGRLTSIWATEHPLWLHKCKMKIILELNIVLQTTKHIEKHRCFWKLKLLNGIKHVVEMFSRCRKNHWEK